MPPKIILILSIFAILLISGCTDDSTKEAGLPKSASPHGPLDTALARITVLATENDIAEIKIENIIDYNRYPAATYPELKAGDEIPVMVYYLAEDSLTSPEEGKKYLAQLSICYNSYIEGLGCAYEGWSAALYPI